MASIRRKSAAVALAVVGVAGLSLASAAQLNVSTASVGANSSVVASCQPDGAANTIKITYTNAYDKATTAYNTSAVVLTGVDGNCAGQAVRVTLADSAGNSLAELTKTVPTGGGVLTLDGINVAAKSIANVAVVIAG